MDGDDNPIELLTLRGELLASGRGQRVETRAPVVLGRFPLGLDPALQQQSLKRGTERAFADVKYFVGHGLQIPGDPVAVHRTCDERREDEEVECSRQQFSSVSSHVWRGETTRGAAAMSIVAAADSEGEGADDSTA